LWLLLFLFKEIALNKSSPEKAGGGGSIPSLATILEASKPYCLRHLQEFACIGAACGIPPVESERSPKSLRLRNGSHGSHPVLHDYHCLLLMRMEIGSSGSRGAFFSAFSSRDTRYNSFSYIWATIAMLVAR
jgi:hypothetical protein